MKKIRSMERDRNIPDKSTTTHRENNDFLQVRPNRLKYRENFHKSGNAPRWTGGGGFCLRDDSRQAGVLKFCSIGGFGDRRVFFRLAEL